METISIIDGLVLTVVSMIVVFIILGAIWGLVELASILINRGEPAADTTGTQVEPIQSQSSVTREQSLNPLESNPKHQKAAELMALVLASEDQPNKKFEIVESKRVK